MQLEGETQSGLAESVGNTPPRPRRRPLACQRCRRRKVRCDALLPSCSNCLKARVPCEEVQGSDRSHTQQLESRIQWLESLVRNVAPDVSIDGDSEYGQFMLQTNQQQPAASGPHYDFTQQTQQVDSNSFDLGQTSEALQTGQLPATVQAHPVNAELQPTPRNSGPSPITPSSTSHISAEQPLAQSVGLISLRHSTDPKYLGPSSGVSFARLIFAAAPPSQGLPIFSGPFTISQVANQDHPSNPSLDQSITPLPPMTEVSHFVSAYVDAFHHLYPFLGETQIEQLVDHAANSGSAGKDDRRTTNIDLVILYLVIALGARTIESQMNTEFSSNKYLETAMNLMAQVQLYESIKGVQIMLLLALATFIFPSAPNAWFLVSTIIASCVDLGLQRKQVSSQVHSTSDTDEAEQNIRRGVFWSAYSLDRTLCTTLGRPLTLRDEAIDIEYPGELGSNELHLSGVNAARTNSHYEHSPATASPEQMTKRRRLEASTSFTYIPSILSFRFDRIVAEIKLMVYRVAQIPERFPWPTNLSQWQQDAYQALQALLQEAKNALRPNRLFNRGSYSDQVLPTLELKYHHCVTILFRPSPAFPRPSAEALRICFESAGETIRIHSDLLRFGRLNNSWLAAHTVFVSGITMLYYAWMTPSILQSESSDFYRRQKSCSEVLAALGRTWSVAKDALEKFDKLVEITKKARSDANPNISDHSQQNNTRVDPLLQGDGQSSSETAAPAQPSGELPQLDASWDIPSALWDELGDMRSWFDLEWFGDANVECGGDYDFP